MSISATNNRQKMVKSGFTYLFLSLFCALFGAIYEHFSHEVFSYYMLYAFVFPLVGGALPFFGIAFSRRKLPTQTSLNLYHSGIATVTVGSIFQGVLEIYGTTNQLVVVYWIAGAVLLFCGIVSYLAGFGKNDDLPSQHENRGTRS